MWFEQRLLQKVADVLSSVGRCVSSSRSIAVFVDELSPATLKLGSSADKALALERLFIGGVPPEETGSSDSFYGCIRNTAVDV